MREATLRRAAAVFGGLALALVGLGAGGGSDAKYVGVQACAKMCHKSSARGKQLQAWQATRHAKAYQTLLGDEAKALAKKTGLAEEPAKSPKCLKCHATGADVPPERRAATLKLEDGVQCESCHGAGEKFKKMSIMKNVAKAKAHGLIIGTEQTCRGCHNETSPSWDPQRYTTKDGKKVGFDYETMWVKIAHPLAKHKK